MMQKLDKVFFCSLPIKYKVIFFVVLQSLIQAFVFNHDPITEQIYCRIEASRITLESVNNEKHFEGLKRIFTNQANFNKYGNRCAWDDTKVTKKLFVWHQRWLQGNPYSALAITLNSGGEVIGHWLIRRTSLPGIAEITFMIDKLWQAQGYGKEAGKAVMKEFVPQLQRYSVGGSPLKAIQATASLDNIASCKLLEGMGFKYIETINRFQSVRKLYVYPIKNI